MPSLFGKIFAGGNERELKRLLPFVDEVNDLEPEVQALNDDELRAKTDAFRRRCQDGESLDDLLPEAFAVVREAGRGPHLITVNDYLAKRDAQWYGRVLAWLGISVGVLQHDASFTVSAEAVSDENGAEYMTPCSRGEAYAADVTYGTNPEFGFDYLRDNMAQDKSRQVQRERHFAIVDEVDNILIDEARTPLIISGQSQEDISIYPRFAALVPRLQRELDFTVDEKLKAISLTESGVEKIEKALKIDNIYAPENYRLTRFMEAALKANILYHRDRDYVVRDGEIVIVDDFTGRLMFGRRWSDGLHQAVEAKEGVKIQQE